jgi:hypothetical protein
MSPQEELQQMTVANIPALDTVVLAGLDLFSHTAPPAVKLASHTRLLVLGSVNALSTGRIIFSGYTAYFADESTYEEALQRHTDIDLVVIVSASGGKHAVPMAQAARAAGRHVALFTNNPAAPARAHVDEHHIHVFPKNREPYSYNTSTYLGMMLAMLHEDPASIKSHLEQIVMPGLLRNFENYSAYTVIVPSRYSHIVPMVRTKFDELFGPMVAGRVFSEEEAKHAKTIVQSPDELFIALGVQNAPYGIPKHRLFVPLPEGGGYVAALMTAYFVVGKIQRAHPPYFAQSIERYAAEVSSYFHQTITPIVE